jgi:peptide/nickel transport system permease protein
LTWRRYAADRAASTLVLLVLGLILIFCIFRVWNRIDPLDVPPDDVRLREFYDGGLLERAGEFVTTLGSTIGYSTFDGASIALPLAKAAAVTLSLVFGAIALGAAAGVPLGRAWANSRRSRGPIGAVVLVAGGLFPLWLGAILVAWAGRKAGLVPTRGYCDFFHPDEGCNGPPDWAWYLLLPWLTMAIPLAATYAVTTRAIVRRTEVLLAAAGPEERPAAARRLRRLNAVAAAKRFGRDVGYLIGIAILWERLFELPGLGARILGAFGTLDPAIQESALVAATVLALGFDLLVNLVGAAMLPEWRTA